MLKSLEKLENGVFCGKGNYGISPNKAKELSDEIQAEIDKYYLPKPLGDDDEPVQFGDPTGLTRNGTVFNIAYIGPGIVLVNVEVADYEIELDEGERFMRPPKPDSQERIDADAYELPGSYVIRYELRHSDEPNLDETDTALMIKHLLERQRKLDGVNND